MPANEMIKCSSEKHLRRQKKEKRKTIIAYQEHVNLKKIENEQKQNKNKLVSIIFFFKSD